MRASLVRLLVCFWHASTIVLTLSFLVPLFFFPLSTFYSHCRERKRSLPLFSPPLLKSDSFLLLLLFRASSCFCVRVLYCCLLLVEEERFERKITLCLFPPSDAPVFQGSVHPYAVLHKNLIPKKLCMISFIGIGNKMLENSKSQRGVRQKDVEDYIMEGSK